MPLVRIDRRSKDAGSLKLELCSLILKSLNELSLELCSVEFELF